MNEIILSVSQLSSYIKEILETSFPDFMVEGEMSNVRPSSAGHLYFSLKDNKALINCVIFRSTLQRLDLRPSDGMKVRIKGRLSVYEPRGSYQIVCSHITEAGTGRILQMLEERKNKYLKAGYFDRELKMSLPGFPVCTAVITSPTGAAVQDILRVLKRRAALCHIIVIPVTVQGETAGRQIEQALKAAETLEQCDSVILARGGGSLEDLLPFSEECVLEAMHDCSLPIITGIGHETDHALADYVSDVRAATPSAAAELLFPERKQLLFQIKQIKNQLSESASGKLLMARKDLRLHSPETSLLTWQHKVDNSRIRVDDLITRLNQDINTYINEKKVGLQHMKSLLTESSPAAIMKKGYTLVYKDGTIIRDKNKLEESDQISIRFHNGRVKGEIIEL